MGVIQLVPKSVDPQQTNAFLTTLTIDTADELNFKAGDVVKLEATIGDASQNKDTRRTLSTSGPIAVYHLDSTNHPVFWLGLENVKISGPTRNTMARLETTSEVTAFAKDLLRACMLYEEEKLNQLYASEVQLLPGNRLFYFGLEVPGKMTEHGVSIKRDAMLVALKKHAAGIHCRFLSSTFSSAHSALSSWMSRLVTT